MARFYAWMIGLVSGLQAFGVFVMAQEAFIPATEISPGPPPVYRLSLEEAQRIALADNTGLTLGQLGVQEKSVAVDAARRDYSQSCWAKRRIWRMLMLEACRLRLVVNTDAECRSGLIGRRGGAIAPESTLQWTAPAVTVFPAAAHGAVAQESLDMSIIKTMSAGTSALFRLRLFGLEQKVGRDGAKGV